MGWSRGSGLGSTSPGRGVWAVGARWRCYSVKVRLGAIGGRGRGVIGGEGSGVSNATARGGRGRGGLAWIQVESWAGLRWDVGMGSGDDGWWCGDLHK